MAITIFSKAGILEIPCPPKWHKILKLYHRSLLWEVLTNPFSSLALRRLIFMALTQVDIGEEALLRCSQIFLSFCIYSSGIHGVLCVKYCLAIVSQVFAFCGHIVSPKTGMERQILYSQNVASTSGSMKELLRSHPHLSQQKGKGKWENIPFFLSVQLQSEIYYLFSHFVGQYLNISPYFAARETRKYRHNLTSIFRVRNRLYC